MVLTGYIYIFLQSLGRADQHSLVLRGFFTRMVGQVYALNI